MSSAASLASSVSNPRVPVAGALLLRLAAVLALGLVAGFALPYWTLDKTTFGRFWPKHGWLLAHIAGGMVALLVGPVQIWLGFMQQKMALHRGGTDDTGRTRLRRHHVSGEGPRRPLADIARRGNAPAMEAGRTRTVLPGSVGETADGRLDRDRHGVSARQSPDVVSGRVRTLG